MVGYNTCGLWLRWPLFPSALFTCAKIFSFKQLAPISAYLTKLVEIAEAVELLVTDKLLG